MTITYNNLAELLDGDPPYRFARRLYRYTDCGPWTVFVVTDKPAHTERPTIEIRKLEPRFGGKLAAHVLVTSSRSAGMNALSFLGFREDGSTARRWRSLNAYLRRVLRYQQVHADRPVGSSDWRVVDVRRCLGCVRVDLERQVAATTRDVYYEDDAANTMIDNCVGIKIGSIVEGSDEGIDPITLTFPFTSDDLDRVVKSINSDAAAVWDWANVRRDKNGRRHPNGKTDAERGMDWPLL